MNPARPSPVRRAALSWLVPALALAVAAPAQAQGGTARAPAAAAAPAHEAVRAEIARRAPSDLRVFYAERGNRPLWLDSRGAPLPAARTLVRLLDTADVDGANRGKLKASRVARAVERAMRQPDPKSAAGAEIALSSALAAYVKAVRQVEPEGVVIESDALVPPVPTAAAVLSELARATSADSHIADMRWMHPFYAPLRRALTDSVSLTVAQRDQLRANLARLRLLPAAGRGRYVLVDTASSRLWMYKDGQVAGTMRVVVGKPDMQTPMMAGFLRYAVVNPYWNVPEDLIRTRIAANVVGQGIGYLQRGGYQVLGDWGDAAKPVRPTLVDWQAVAAGAPAPRVRQLPGRDNFMGRVKFMFPNELGIYLHDTPDRHLLALPDRQLSSGCVRLEDAARLGRWLLGKPLPARGGTPERRVDLPEPVPIYITYLTAMPEKGAIAFRGDTYGRDAPANSRGSRAAR